VSPGLTPLKLEQAVRLNRHSRLKPFKNVPKEALEETVLFDSRLLGLWLGLFANTPRVEVRRYEVIASKE